MLISYVLRLRSDALAKGRFVGEIEAVSTRQRSSVRTVDQMAAFILGTSGQIHDIAWAVPPDVQPAPPAVVEGGAWA